MKIKTRKVRAKKTVVSAGARASEAEVLLVAVMTCFHPTARGLEWSFIDRGPLGAAIGRKAEERLHSYMEGSGPIFGGATTPSEAEILLVAVMTCFYRTECGGVEWCFIDSGPLSTAIGTEAEEQLRAYM
jgi:hypothetical protein